MRLTTIWTMPGMTLRERVRRTNELAVMRLAHRVPQRFAYWVLIDQGARHIQGNEVVPEVPFMRVLERAGRSMLYSSHGCTRG